MDLGLVLIPLGSFVPSVSSAVKIFFCGLKPRTETLAAVEWPRSEDSLQPGIASELMKEDIVKTTGPTLPASVPAAKGHS
jgi:hypothetical protein